MRKKHVLGPRRPPQGGFGGAALYYTKPNFSRLTIQEPIISVPNTEFEGGDDGRGYGDYTFLVKQAQPSYSAGALFRLFMHNPAIQKPSQN
jgi:hypothetical protein